MCVCVFVCECACICVKSFRYENTKQVFEKTHLKNSQLDKRKRNWESEEQATSNELKFFRAEERKQRLQKAGSAVEEVPKGKEEQ